MGKEGAMKGIMVTTSFYGKDFWEYVQGLPLTLLDGQHLIQMSQEMGYNVRIQLKNNQGK